MILQTNFLPTRTFANSVSLARSYYAQFSGSGEVVLTDGGGHKAGQSASLEFPAGTATSILLPRTFNLNTETPGGVLGSDGQGIVTVNPSFGYLLQIAALSPNLAIAVGRVLF